MGLGASFWSGLGEDVLWYDLSELNQGFIYPSPDPDGKVAIAVGSVEIYQEPTTVGGTQNRVQNSPGFDSGYFYALETSTGEILWCDPVFVMNEPRPIPNDCAQWVMMEPLNKPGDLHPETTQSPNKLYANKSPLYKTGFQQKEGVAFGVGHIEGGNEIALRVHAEHKVGSWRLHHYNPWAWVGSPPAVVAAAAMYAGLSDEDIDQDSFDDAHDAYDVSTGDAPWTGLDYQWTLHARRTVGQKVTDFLTICANHGRDFIFVNEAGKLSCSSFTSPSFTSDGLNLADDQVIGVVGWDDTVRHLFNTVRAGWGMAARQSWADAPGSTYFIPLSTMVATVFEPTLETSPTDKWVDIVNDTGSVSQYGIKWLKGHKTLVNYSGHPQEIEKSHYPFLLSPFVNRATLYEWDRDVDGGGMLHVTHWLASDAKPRKEINLRQGPVAFDAGIGDELTNVEVTGDGATIAVARIIKRTYNFDAMTIDSIIMEIPPNT